MTRSPGSSPQTIAAVATARGRAGIGVVRVSGPRVPLVAEAVLGGLPPPRKAVHRLFRGETGEPIDSGLAIFFPEPGSFTGEPVLELHGHGGPVVLDLLLARVLSLGVLAARPGEFSERAFSNGKLDLTQAEAIADLIDSSTAEAARSAHRSLTGVFSSKIRTLVDDLTELRTYVEAAIDFAEEELDFLSDSRLNERLQKISSHLEQTLASAYQGCLLRDGMTVVIAGRPNVGKSSLLNALAGRDSAIVTEIPGTTRDILREQIQLDGLPLHVIDTAGLREAKDRVEKIGIDRAWHAINEADALILVLEEPIGLGPEDRAILERLPRGPDRVLVYNKIDLTGRPASVGSEPSGDAIYLSAATAEGLELLTEHLKGLMGFTATEGVFMARRRHLDALRRARQALARGRENLLGDQAGELLAEDLRQAQLALGEITGEVTTEDLLGRIFSSFCIGK